MLKRIRKILGRNNASLYFDREYYLSAYPDVALSGIDPYQHYMNFGWREGRNPSPGFHVLFYVAENFGYKMPVNPLLHYLSNNKGKGLRTFPESDEELISIQKRILLRHFDATFYRSRYLGSKPSKDPLDHYLTSGWLEGFDPRADFSTKDYVRSHPHILASKVSPLFHYVLVELQRHDLAAPKVQMEPSAQVIEIDRKTVVKTIAVEFDEKFYNRTNPDVRLGGAPPVLHYVDYGWKEGRDPNAIFWTSYYLSRNPDVSEGGLNPFYHYLTFGRQGGRKPNPVGLSLWPVPAAPTKDEWRLAISAKGVTNAQIDVIIPVYKGFSDTLACIHAVLSNAQRTPFNLLVVNDCSPEPQLTEELLRLHEQGLFDYLENNENLGFVGTVNKALAIHPERDVILLNSDAIVHGNWIDRILAHAKRDENVATITPFSNNATICSYPLANQNNVLALEVTLDELDDCAKACNSGLASVIPTGVGFCMYIRRAIMRRIGILDEQSFGRGYGEENDYCMRALKAGFKNLFAHDVFVYHAGQLSFAEYAGEALSKGQVALTRKHPDYPARVQLYIGADPAREARLRLDLYRLARSFGSKTALMVSRSHEGGIATHVHYLAARLKDEGFKILNMIVSGRDDMHLSVDDANLSVFTPSIGSLSISKQSELISEFIQWLKPEIFHVHSFVGLDWAPTLSLMSVIERAAPRYYCTLHDFTPVCHRNHLVTDQGEFCNERHSDICDRCFRSEFGFNYYVNPLEREQSYGAFLEKATRVFVPSYDTAERFKQIYPRAEFTVRPHQETLPAISAPDLPPTDSLLRVAVIGAIGLHKGSHIIHALALDARQRALPISFKIFGISNLRKELENLGVEQTGRYDVASEALDRLGEWRPHLAFFPSIWPETYCYTLSLAFAAGLPPVVFDIGAPAERLRALKQGQILDYGLTRSPSALNDALLGLPIEGLWKKRRSCEPPRYESILNDYYETGPRLST